MDGNKTSLLWKIFMIVLIFIGRYIRFYAVEACFQLVGGILAIYAMLVLMGLNSLGRYIWPGEESWWTVDGRTIFANYSPHSGYGLCNTLVLGRTDGNMGAGFYY
ncbi:hypothetical protein A2Z33_04435 [Candidatus Gottesmanbacteria bacterium RBG_16_52_11]|uniref:Uncharacterized protein n=1 Tax=Candidatus Gottesmanbacteria bacterium RBG_16_52_11 TaxID=1798374 RepID=A0A1F5YW16_9BACT|nr:MAG: hypothetical protein A2Z33_04435 [Candidatus Gottesmanbacteria bacterium RBG_16_52_11]